MVNIRYNILENYHVFEKQKMHYEDTRIRNRAIEKGIRETQTDRVNFNK